MKICKDKNGNRDSKRKFINSLQKKNSVNKKTLNQVYVNFKDQMKDRMRGRVRVKLKFKNKNENVNKYQNKL